MRLRLDRFALRQWEEGYVGSRLSGITPADFERELQRLAAQPDVRLVDGYAPFCKHIFVRNWIAGLKAPTLALSDAVAPLVRSEYQARTASELPVLVRWVPASAVAARPDAAWLDVILYSKAQIVAETRAQGADDDTSTLDYDWGVISVKVQDEARELPMTPITMMRNALGKEEGGSGVPLDRAKYLESVEYWSRNITVVE